MPARHAGLRVLPIILVLFVAGCEGILSPSDANIVSRGSAQIGKCTISATCDYTVELENTGKGCAAAVRATVEARNISDAILSSSSSDFAGSMRPGEVTSRTFCCINPTGAAQLRVWPSWDNVKCP